MLNKNKLRFSKYFNLFDIVILVSAMMALTFLAFYLLRRTATVEVVIKLTNRNVLYTKNTDPPSWFADYFQVGMMANDSLGRKKAEIIKVASYDASISNKAVYLTTKLTADYSKGKNQYSYEGAPLIIGSPLKIEMQSIFIDGLLVAIKGVKDPRREKEIVVEAQIIEYQDIFPETTGVFSFVDEALVVGDKITDSLDNVVVNIINKKSQPAKKITTDTFGNLWLKNDPLKKDVYLTLKLKTKEINGEYYLFDDVRVKIGESLPLHFKNISIYPTVTKIVNSD